MASTDQRAPGEDITHAEVELVNAERLTFFSDAVVAIAITLLALDLPVPEGLTNADVLHVMNQHSEAYIAFLISFAVISSHWHGHHRIFGYVTMLRGRLARWSMLWLLMIVITPFATRTLTLEGGFQVRFILYAAVQALAGLFFLLMVRSMDRHHVLREDTPPGVLNAAYRRLILLIVAFTVSIPVAFVTHWAYLCWVAMPFVSRGLGI
jgi:uncharacterized membrane protein